MTSAFTLAEIALVVSLTSSKIDITWSAASCLKRLIDVEAAGLIAPKDVAPESQRAREAAYQALGDGTVLVTGKSTPLRWMPDLILSLFLRPSSHAKAYTEIPSKHELP